MLVLMIMMPDGGERPCVASADARLCDIEGILRREGADSAEIRAYYPDFIKGRENLHA